MIRLSALGDVAMTVPVLLALTKGYPKLKITVLTRGFFLPLFNNIPNVTIYGADVKGTHRGLSGLLILFRELKLMKFDAVADLHNVLRSNVLTFFFKLVGIPCARIDKGRRDKRALTAEHAKIFTPLRSTHERYAAVFDQLGFPISLEQTHIVPGLPLSEKIMAFAGSRALKWIGIAPFAAFKGKMYPLAMMEEVIGPLATSGMYKLLLFGGGAEEQRQLESWEAKWQHCAAVPGKLRFEEELVLISNLDVMVSMDSGNGHLAAMFGIPTITLWGITHPFAGFAPFAQPPENAILADREKYPFIPTSVYGNKMPVGYERAMETIPPEKVISKIRNILNVTRSSRQPGK